MLASLVPLLTARRLALASVVCLALLPAHESQACTTFLLKTERGLRVGKSYDWHTAQGRVIWNPAGLSKEALLLAPGDKPARWTARHASLTFNQYGREMPNGGMNTAGLVVEIMWLDSSEYPATDDRPALGELQWIQHVLDQAATVDEAIGLARQVRVRPLYGKVHYLACDRGGACASFEYIDGRLEVRSGDDLPVPTLTNDSYDDSLSRLRYHRGFGGSNPLPLGKGSPERFVRASARAQALAARPPKELTHATFRTLDSVRNGDYTKWQIVYDPIGLSVAFRTLHTPTIKRIALAGLDPGCDQPALALDIDHRPAGDAAAKLSPWTAADNASLLRASLKPMLAGKSIPADSPQMLTRYAEAARCAATPTAVPGTGSVPRSAASDGRDLGHQGQR